MAFSLLTRAQFRDSIRRKLGIVPPIDISLSNPAGAQPTNSPYPTNMQINDALQDAISDVNRECGFHVNRFSVPVPVDPSVPFGPFRIDLSNLAPNTEGVLVAPTGRIIDVKRVLWYPGLVREGTPTTPPVLLYPTTRDNLDRSDNNNYYAAPSSFPQGYYVEEYSLWITPGQSEDGTYLLTCGTGITGLQCDNDVIDQIPIDYQNIFDYGGVYHLSITQTMDAEAQARAQAFGPLFTQGMVRFKSWINDGTGAAEPVMLFRSYRGGYGTRRVVR